jgi:hypothetical protein
VSLTTKLRTVLAAIGPPATRVSMIRQGVTGTNTRSSAASPSALPAAFGVPAWIAAARRVCEVLPSSSTRKASFISWNVGAPSARRRIGNGAFANTGTMSIAHPRGSTP